MNREKNNNTPWEKLNLTKEDISEIKKAIEEWKKFIEELLLF